MAINLFRSTYQGETNYSEHLYCSIPQRTGHLASGKVFTLGSS